MFKFEEEGVNMKKVLVVSIMFFAIVSSAPAAMIGLDVVGGTAGRVAGENLTINLIADTACNGFLIGAMGDGGAGGTLIPNGSDPVTFGTGITAIDKGFVDNVNGVLFDVVSAYAQPARASGNVLMSFVYQISSSWTGLTSITIAPIRGMYDPGIGSIEAGPSYGDLGTTGNVDITGVTITPEPVTVALLGLGGLFLRRRK